VLAMAATTRRTRTRCRRPNRAPLPARAGCRPLAPLARGPSSRASLRCGSSSRSRWAPLLQWCPRWHPREQRRGASSRRPAPGAPPASLPLLLLRLAETDHQEPRGEPKARPRSGLLERLLLGVRRHDPDGVLPALSGWLAALLRRHPLRLRLSHG